jgi:hypothetical protein
MLPGESYVLVDPDGTSGYWYRTIRAKVPNARFIAVWSTIETKHRLMRFIPHQILPDFELVYGADTIRQIQNIGTISRVLPGSDQSIWLVETLQSRLTPSLSNDPSTMDFRRDKVSIYSRLHEIGLIGQSHVIVPGKPHDHVRITEECVIKPVIGRGGYGVRFLHTQDDLGRYLSSTNIGDGFIVQKRHRGTEFSVDMITISGCHVLTAVWRYEKPNDATHIKEEVTLVDPYKNAELVAGISRYVRKILTALDVHHGPSHTEVIVDSTGMINLVEVNLRLHGHLDETAVRASLGRNQIEMSSGFLPDQHKISEDDTFAFHKPLKKVFLNNMVPKNIQSIDWTQAENLIKPNFHTVYKHSYLYPGHVGQTTNVGNSLGVVVMVGRDMARWGDDVTRIRAWKRDIVNAAELVQP